MRNNTYDAILRMILKNTKTTNVPFYSNGDYGVINSGTAPSEDFSNPYYLVTLDNYDYQLTYNVDDELIGFTSNNGSWIWTFGMDSFEDLTYVLVENPYTPFMISLIFENYDVRNGDLETEEKGNLVEVVLIKKDDTTVPVDPDTTVYPILSITPELITIVAGDYLRYSVLLTVSLGNVVDVTDMCEWTFSSELLYMEGIWVPGVIDNTVGLSGTYTITATYDGVTVASTLIV